MSRAILTALFLTGKARMAIGNREEKGQRVPPTVIFLLQILLLALFPWGCVAEDKQTFTMGAILT